MVAKLLSLRELGLLWAAAVVLAGAGLTTATLHGGFVASQFLVLALLLAAASLLLPLPFTATPATYCAVVRQITLSLLPLAALNLLNGSLPQLSPSWAQQFATLGVCASISTAAAFWLFPHLGPLPRPLATILRWPYTVWLLAGLWAAIYGALTIGVWHNFNQYSQDMAIYEQALYNTLHGRFLQYSCDIRLGGQIFCRFGDHFEPVLLLFVPLYALWRTPIWFLAAQAITIASGAVPVAALARRWTGSNSAGLLLALIYLTHPGPMQALHFDFHLSTLTAGLLLWGLYFALEGHAWPAIGFLVLAMGCKENIPATVAMVGLYLAYQGQRRFGLGLLLLSAAWFVIAVKAVIPQFSPTGQWFYTHGLADPRPQLAGHQALIFLRARLDYLADMMAGGGGLALLSPATLLLAAPELLVNCLGRARWMHSLEAYYHVTAVAGIVMASASALGGIFRRVDVRVEPPEQALVVRRALLLCLLLLLLQSLYAHRQPYLFPARPPGYAAADVAALRRLAAQVPDEVPVLVNTGALASHMARRPMLLFRFKPGYATPDVLQGVANVRYVFLQVPLSAPEELRFRRHYHLQLRGHVRDHWLWEVIPSTDRDRMPIHEAPASH